MTQLINPEKFTEAVTLLRDFFLARNFQEVHTQNRLSILAACEDPTTVATNIIMPEKYGLCLRLARCGLNTNY